MYVQGQIYNSVTAALKDTLPSAVIASPLALVQVANAVKARNTSAWLGNHQTAFRPSEHNQILP